MHCPRCNAEMEPGELDLKAWGVGIAPQAQLLFNGDLLMKDKYIPIVGIFTGGTGAPAFRCRRCSLVCFQYVVPAREPEIPLQSASIASDV